MESINLPPLLFIFPLIGLYWLTRSHLHINNLILLIAGYLVYAWGNPLWGVILLISTLWDYVLVRFGFSHKKTHRPALWLGILANVGLWLIFKYPATFNWLVQTDTQLTLPLGMSFYMLRKISFLLEWKHGEDIPVHFVDYALYVSFLPQLFSGPIDRPRVLLPQIRKTRSLNWPMLLTAISLLMASLFKKIVVADNLRIMVARIFSLDLPSRLLLAAGSLAFTFEILADFSAYTDISRAAALLLGFETSENFNEPYLSISPQDFWNRWHITFSHWLRDTIFFPLRRALLRSPLRNHSLLVLAIPPLATMTLSGIWHGTGWNYLLWGLYYGVLIVIYQALGIDAALQRAGVARKFLAWLFMFILIMLGWGLFRAPDVAWYVNAWIHAPWGLSGDNWVAFLAYLTPVSLFILPVILQTLINFSGRWRDYLQPLFAAVGMVILAIFIGSGFQDFVYFRF